MPPRPQGPAPRIKPPSPLLIVIFVLFILSAAWHYKSSSTSPIVSTPGQHAVAGTRKTRIVAVGDLHGDSANALKVLQMAGVVDGQGSWTGDVDYFVQTGDIVDRGDDTIKLFTWMEDLRVQAEKVGGRVLSHLGNHEFMNAIGDWRYVPDSEIRTFGSVASRQKMLTTGRIGRAWATNYSVTSRVPLHPTFGPPNTPYPPSGSTHKTLPRPFSHAAYSFLHGGLSPTYPNLTPFPSAINALGSSLLKKLQSREQPAPHPPNPYPGLPHDATSAEKELYDANGPLWYRGWAMLDDTTVCSQVDAVLDMTGTRRMIMGHTPDFTKQVSRCGGKIIIIDTGISHAYGGVLSALSIEYALEPLPQLSASGQKQWKETEFIKAIYPGKEEIFVNEERIIAGDV